jgi:AcrR family transcriptional regulator
MQKQRGIGIVRSVLDPTIPVDVGVLSQRQRIVDAMLQCCAEKTYAATTIADIVSAASISRTTFYKRFGGKRECFDATLDWCIEQLTEAVRGSRSPADDPATAVRRAAAAILELMASKPVLAQLVMGEAMAVEPDAVARYRRLVIPAIEGLWDQPTVRTDPRLSFGRAQVLLYNEILGGHAERLPALLPELVYIALLPFAGHEEALRQAREAGHDSAAELGG